MNNDILQSILKVLEGIDECLKELSYSPQTYMFYEKTAYVGRMLNNLRDEMEEVQDDK